MRLSLLKEKFKWLSRRLFQRRLLARSRLPVAPAISASPVPAAVPPTPVSAPAPNADKQDRKGQAAGKAVDRAAETPEVKWARRLGRWRKKAEAQGIDARALMQEALAS
jgi:hypothetical protein